MVYNIRAFDQGSEYHDALFFYMHTTGLHSQGVVKFPCNFTSFGLNIWELLVQVTLSSDMLPSLGQPRAHSVIYPAHRAANLWSTPAVQEELFDSNGRIIENPALDHNLDSVLSERLKGSSLRTAARARTLLLGSQTNALRARASTFTPQELKSARQASNSII